MSEIKILINNKKHPHYEGTGYLTGKIVNLFSIEMAEVKLINDPYDVEKCFVSKEDFIILEK